MDDEFKDLQALLRLKKYEAPPAEYFEDFLFEFHRAQRAEMLRRPLWRLALDRLEGALPTFTPARYAYAGSFALATAVAVVTSGHILASQPHGSRSAGTALVAKTRVAIPTRAAAARLDLDPSRSSSTRLTGYNFDQPHQYTAAAKNARPRYVLDTQPVSYEQPSSF